MKRTIYNIFSLLSMAAVLFLAVSCEDEKPLDSGKTSNFPELVENHDVEPGTLLTLTIQPNAAWSLTVNKESYAWFKIKDGKFDKQTLSGVSLSEPKEITIWTTSEESFDLRSCQVTLTVKGESKVIAKYTLRAKAKTIEAYEASVTESGAFEYADGGYVYVNTPMSADDVIELVWDENEKMYYSPVKITANYDWTVEWPSWARADINVDSKVGDTCFEIYGIPSELPLDDSEGVISFKDGDNVVKNFNVKIPGCRNIMTYNIGGNLSLTYDHAQYLITGSGSASKEPLPGILFGPSGARILILEKNGSVYSETAEPWIDLDIDAWDSVEGASVLQERKFTISVPVNYSLEDRNAMLLFLPANAPSDISQILSSDGTSVKEEYAAYAVPVLQKACPDEYITFEAEADILESSGLIFEKSLEEILPEKNFEYAEGSSEWQYNVSYIKEMASAKSAFYVTFPYESLAIYDTDGNEITENLSEHWLSYNSLIDGHYGQIVMDMTKFVEGAPSEIDGYIVFKNEKGKVLASIHCKYKAEVKAPEDVLVDVGSTMFVDPKEASEAGATIYYVESGPTYEEYKDRQAPVYIVTYTCEDKPLMIKTSSRCTSYEAVGKKNGPEMVTIDDQIFTDPVIVARLEEYYRQMDLYKEGKLSEEPKYPDTSDERSTMGLLKFGSTSFESRVYNGKSKFAMKKAVVDGNEITSEVIQFGAEQSGVMFVFICRLEIPTTSEE